MPLPRFFKLPAARREALLDAALFEFSEHGFEQASLNAILARTGTSKGAAYYYFADKQDLYVTTLGHALAEVGRRAPGLGPVSDAASFWREVARLYEAVIRLVSERPEVLRLLRRDLSRIQTLAAGESLAPLLANARTFMDTILRAGREVRALRDDLPEPLMLDLVFAVGQSADAYMVQSGEIATARGRKQGMLRALDLLRRMLEPSGTKKVKPRS